MTFYGKCVIEKQVLKIYVYIFNIIRTPSTYHCPQNIVETCQTIRAATDSSPGWNRVGYPEI